MMHRRWFFALVATVLVCVSTPSAQRAVAGPMRVVLLSAVTTGTSQPIDVTGRTVLTFYVKTNGSPGAGTVILEEADWGPTEVQTSLTWSNITTLTVTMTPGNSTQSAYHVSQGSHFVRARIGTTVTSTTVDVVLIAQ